MPDIFSKERITKPNVNIDFQKFHFQNYLVFVCRTIPFAWNLITAGYVEQTIPGVIFFILPFIQGLENQILIIYTS